MDCKFYHIIPEYADCFGFREFKTVSIHPVMQLIQRLLKMSLNDVNKLGTIAYEEVVHVKRAFNTGGYTFSDRDQLHQEDSAAV